MKFKLLFLILFFLYTSSSFSQQSFELQEVKLLDSYNEIKLIPGKILPAKISRLAFEIPGIVKKIDADIIVSRAFKKIDRIIDISREIQQKPHKIIILKGKNAQDEINKVSLGSNYSYKLEKSITDNDSKIIVIDVKKNE